MRYLVHPCQPDNDGLNQEPPMWQRLQLSPTSIDNRLRLTQTIRPNSGSTNQRRLLKLRSQQTASKAEDRFGCAACRRLSDESFGSQIRAKARIT
jgi:hypothetical protein